MIWKILAYIIASILGALFYRMGGAAGYNTKVRDIGCPLVACALLIVLAGWNWWLIPCFGLYFGALTTYWKKKGADATWLNWIFVGLGYSFAFLPYSIATHHYLGFAIRAVLVTVLTSVWSNNIGNPVTEECGRGFISTATIPLLLFQSASITILPKSALKRRRFLVVGQFDYT